MSIATDKYFYFQIGKPQEKADYGDLYYFSQAILVLEGKLNGIIAGTSSLVPNTLPNGQILVGNASNVATAVAMSGEATIINTGAVTLSNAAVIGKVLTGFVVGANTPIVAADTILQAFGKTQGQISAIVAAGGITSLNAQTGAIQTFVNDTNVTVVSALNAHTITWSGTLADARIASAATWNAKLTSVLPSTNIFVGNGGNVATAVAMSGDGTLSNTGALTIANSAVTTVKLNNNAVTYAKIQQASATTLLGNPTGAPANVSEITLGVGLSFAGTVLNAAATPLTLTQNQIAFGDASNLMTSSANLTWVEASRNLTANGTISLALANSANVFYVAQGNVGFWFTGAASTGLLAHQGFGIDFDAGKNLYTMGDVGITNNTHIEVDDVAQTIKIVEGSLAAASNGDVWTLQDDTTGEGAWAAGGGGSTIVTDPNWTALGETVYGTGASTGAILPGNTNADRRILSSTGTGAVSAAPVWIRFDAGDILSGTIAAARMPALTGDVTTVAGTVATTIKNDVALAGNPTTTTQAASDNSTRIATTAFVKARFTGIINFSSATFNPLDSTTYYMGALVAQVPQGTAGFRRVYFTHTCTITSVVLNPFVTVASSAQNTEFYIRVNNTTDYQITTTAFQLTAASAMNVYSNLAMSVPITAGDYIEVKMVCPVYATNPTGVFMQGTIGFE